MRLRSQLLPSLCYLPVYLCLWRLQFYHVWLEKPRPQFYKIFKDAYHSKRFRLEPHSHSQTKTDMQLGWKHGVTLSALPKEASRWDRQNLELDLQTSDYKPTSWWEYKQKHFKVMAKHLEKLFYLHWFTSLLIAKLSLRYSKYSYQ